MQYSFEEVEKLAHALPEDQRIRLANSLYESVGEEGQGTEAEIEAAWGDEIKRRLDGDRFGKSEDDFRRRLSVPFGCACCTQEDEIEPLERHALRRPVNRAKRLKR